MVSTLALGDLLTQAGARPARYGTKWLCPNCPANKSASLSVDLEEAVFCCHRCRWKGNGISLARELGITIGKPNDQELHRRRIARKEAARFHRWWQERLDFYRDTLWLLNDIEREVRPIAAEYLARNDPVPEWVWNQIHFVGRERPRFESQHRIFADPKRHAGELLRLYRDGWERKLAA